MTTTTVSKKMLAAKAAKKTPAKVITDDGETTKAFARAALDVLAGGDVEAAADTDLAVSKGKAKPVAKGKAKDPVEPAPVESSVGHTIVMPMPAPKTPAAPKANGRAPRHGDDAVITVLLPDARKPGTLGAQKLALMAGSTVSAYLAAAQAANLPRARQALAKAIRKGQVSIA